MPGYLPKPPSPRLNKGNPLARGLVLALPFYEGSGVTVNDLSGNGNDGVINGSLERVNTPFGAGIGFDGSSNNINCGDNLSLDINEAITMSAWIKTNTNTVRQSIIHKEDGYQLAIAASSSKKLHGYLWGIGNEGWLIGNTDIENNVWYHVTMTYDSVGGGGKLYLNGVLDGIRAWTGMWGSVPTKPVGIGGRIVPDFFHFNGQIDNAHIWNRALSFIEISQLYHDSFSMYRFPYNLNIFSIPPTNNIYRATRHILETYDGIPGAALEYNDLSTTRGFWKVGRQITARETSSKYLEEMAKQAFLSIYPTRKGKRGIKAWRDDATVIATHDESKILKDENNKPLITRYEKIPLSKVFNDIELNYDYNPGLKKYNKSIFITNTDQATFPEFHECTGTDTSRATTDFQFVVLNGELAGYAQFAADPSGWAKVGGIVSWVDSAGPDALFGEIIFVGATSINFKFTNTYGCAARGSESGTLYSQDTAIAKWTTYVSGAPDYASSKIWWDICSGAYDETQVVSRLKIDCSWFIDNADFGESGGTNNTVYYLLNQILEWCTRQKYLVEYALPITAANIQMELNDPINFNDQKFTNNTDRLGYIKQIKIVPSSKKPMIVIQLILQPFNIETFNLIIETGSAPDTITESGSQPDTITEGAQ